MIRDGFRFVDEANNDYRYQISNKKLHEICGTSDLTNFIAKQQVEYAKHVIRMSHERYIKLLMFNEDKYKKRGRPFKTLLDQAIEHNNSTLDGLCNSAILRK